MLSFRDMSNTLKFNNDRDVIFMFYAIFSIYSSNGKKHE